MQIRISERLKQLRAINSYSQGQVATQLGINRSTYATYEEGRANPSYTTLTKLAELYCFKSVEEMLSEKKQQRPVLIEKYAALSIEKRKIVDFILNTK